MGIPHNQDGFCPVCKYHRLQEKLKDDNDGEDNAKGKRKKRFGKKDSLDFEPPVVVGDPMVTAGKNQESISVFKDMYGIFKIREKIEDNCSHHKKPTTNQSKTTFKRKTQIKKLRKSIERKTEGIESVESLNSKKLEF